MHATCYMYVYTHTAFLAFQHPQKRLPSPRRQSEWSSVESTESRNGPLSKAPSQGWSIWWTCLLACTLYACNFKLTCLVLIPPIWYTGLLCPSHPHDTHQASLEIAAPGLFQFSVRSIPRSTYPSTLPYQLYLVHLARPIIPCIPLS